MVVAVLSLGVMVTMLGHSVSALYCLAPMAISFIKQMNKYSDGYPELQYSTIRSF